MPWPMRFGPPPRMTIFCLSDGSAFVGDAGERPLHRSNTYRRVGDANSAAQVSMRLNTGARRARGVARSRRPFLPVSTASGRPEKPFRRRSIRRRHAARPCGRILAFIDDLRGSAR